MISSFLHHQRSGKGTGLGLSTVFGLVEAGRRQHLVTARYGQGTAFKLYFPRVDAELDDQSSPRLRAELGGNETILIAEDDAPVRAIARRILEKNGYRVLVADTAADAVRLCETHEADIDLLLTDVVMPGGTGPELAARLRDLRPRLRVLYMSGYTDGSVISQGLAGATSFLQKPFTGELLTCSSPTALDCSGLS